MLTRRSTQSGLALLGLPVALLMGCTGAISTQGEKKSNGNTGDDDGGHVVDVCVGGSDACPGDDKGRTYAPLDPPVLTMQRLTVEQYNNSLADIFGEKVLPTTQPDQDDALEMFSSIGAHFAGTSTLGVEKYEAAAFEVAGKILADIANQPMLSGCAAPDKANDPCIEQSLRDIGQRLFRRPLTDAEIGRYLGIVATDGDGKDKVAMGMKYALGTLLQSPNFLYIAYVGDEDADTGFQRLTGYEMASRLAYFLWNSTPDVELLSAAERGDLGSREGLNSEIQRMLDQPRARTVFTRFLSEYWMVSRMQEDGKNTEVFPNWNRALRDAYVKEFEMLVEDTVFNRDEDVLNLLDRRTTFANETLTRMYDMGGGNADFGEVDLPETRRGILTSGAVLAANSRSDRTSPTNRGVFLLERVLCEEPPPPPEDVPPLEDVTDFQTQRERLEKHRVDPACSGCHDLIDPLGLTLEHYDGIGAFRTMDGEYPVDATGEYEDVKFDGAMDVIDFMLADSRPVPCLAKGLHSFATGHTVTDGELGLIQALGDTAVDNGNRMKSLLASVATSPGFRYFKVER